MTKLLFTITRFLPLNGLHFHDPGGAGAVGGNESSNSRTPETGRRTVHHEDWNAQASSLQQEDQSRSLLPNHFISEVA
jgi:hypothetical protein